MDEYGDNYLFSIDGQTSAQMYWLHLSYFFDGWDSFETTAIGRDIIIASIQTVRIRNWAWRLLNLGFRGHIMAI